jgi:hypothetical protein
MILPLLHLKKLWTYIFGNHELRIKQWTMDKYEWKWTLTLENLGHFGLRIHNINELYGHNINGMGNLKRKTLHFMDL